MYSMIKFDKMRFCIQLIYFEYYSCFGKNKDIFIYIFYKVLVNDNI